MTDAVARALAAALGGALGLSPVTIACLSADPPSGAKAVGANPPSVSAETKGLVLGGAEPAPPPSPLALTFDRAAAAREEVYPLVATFFE